MKKMTLLLILAGLVVTACDKKDECLDSGGHYNQATQQCEK